MTYDIRPSLSNVVVFDEMTRRSDALDRKYDAMCLFQGRQRQKIAKRFAAGATFAQLRREFGGSTDAIRSAIVRGGGALPPNQKPKLTDAEKRAALEFVAAGNSPTEAARFIERPPTTIIALARSAGIKGPPRIGRRSPNWRGGEIPYHGYIRAWVSPDDRFAGMRDSAGYVLKHRLVMARALGRPLGRHETVHHIDDDRFNNILSNLQLRQGKNGKGTVLRCADCGSHNVVSVEIAKG